MGDLTADFDRKEFSCSCGCGFDDVDNNFIQRLQWARDNAGIPFKITSGCRCPAHNKKVGGKNTSDHVTGEGADVEVIGSMSRFIIIDAAIRAGFKRIGIGKTFIHLGTNHNNPIEVCWLY